VQRSNGRSAGGDHQRRAIAAAARRAELPVPQLWLRYFGLGGTADPAQVEAYLRDGPLLPAAQADLLAHAVNERIDELLRVRRAPYSRVVREARPQHGPLASLVQLLDGMQTVPPERLPQALSAAGAAIGVEIVAYLVDYEQRRLVPLLSPEERRPALEVSATLAGRAFRRVEMLPAEAGGPRLWVPLMDGAERLGVLEVVVDGPDDLYDPLLREQCHWIARLAGHLVVATSDYGDGLDVLRRSRPRTSAAELIWQLLPPLAASTRAVEVAGLVEPSYSVGGDAFDYALGEGVASLAIFDAAGHSLLSGMVAAAALSAYRAARRGGAGLYEQARAIDDTVGDLFGRTSCFVTGVLAELDTAVGRLRYLTAGHPAPLLMRDGKVVRVLDDAHRALFGISAARNLPAAGAAGAVVRIGEETLQPGDWLVLYTDGLVEARDREGDYFGDERLVDLLRREIATGHAPPEVLRRLVHAVIDHQAGVLQDDATVVVARWNGR
jgi:Stage II sporulation protein E (SpoIIE)